MIPETTPQDVDPAGVTKSLGSQALDRKFHPLNIRAFQLEAGEGGCGRGSGRGLAEHTDSPAGQT